MPTLLPISGHTYRSLEKDEEERAKKLTNPDKPWRPMIRVNKEGWLLDENFKIFAEKFANFKIRPTDVFVITFQKAGTTWTQELVWTMLLNPNLDHKDQHLPVLHRSLFLDFDIMIMGEVSPNLKKNLQSFFDRFREKCPEGDETLVPHLQLAETQPNPRVLKLHLPLSLLPKDILKKAKKVRLSDLLGAMIRTHANTYYCVKLRNVNRLGRQKIVYVARDPRDIVTSLHHHNRLMGNLIGTVDDRCEKFMKDDVVNGPYWMHVKEAWQVKDHPNFHFMLYEDMKADITNEIHRLNAFLGTNLTPQQIENVKKHTAFDAMKARDAECKTGIKFDPEIVKNEGGFFRQGKTGDGKKKLSIESLKKMDDWIKKHFDLGLNFD